jgi:hypothetical protein
MAAKGGWSAIRSPTSDHRRFFVLVLVVFVFVVIIVIGSRGGIVLPLPVTRLPHGSLCRQLAWNSAFAASSVGALGCQWNSEPPKIERINCGRKMSSCENEQSALNGGFLQTRKRLRKS